jgi:ribosomal protein L11 methyltransferase
VRPQVVEVTAPAAEAELAADTLWAAGAVAVEERVTPAGTVLVAATVDGDPAGLLAAAAAGRWPSRVRAIDLDAALDAWRDHARPVAVGDRLRIRPPWLPPAVDGRVEVAIDPGRAFGSGAHASTRLALAALDDLVGGSETVLDVGCGSGVLALAALALGAASATGVDVDPEALAACAANAERNGLSDRLTLGRTVPAGRHYELVVANMLLPDLVALVPVVRGALAPGAALVLSGVLADQAPALAAAYDGLACDAERADEGWLAVTLRP